MDDEGKFVDVHNTHLISLERETEQEQETVVAWGVNGQGSNFCSRGAPSNVVECHWTLDCRCIRT